MNNLYRAADNFAFKIANKRGVVITDAELKPLRKEILLSYSFGASQSITHDGIY
jgi:hypothetical protein